VEVHTDCAVEIRAPPVAQGAGDCPPPAALFAAASSRPNRSLIPANRFFSESSSLKNLLAGMAIACPPEEFMASTRRDRASVSRAANTTCADATPAPRDECDFSGHPVGEVCVCQGPAPLLCASFLAVLRL